MQLLQKDTENRMDSLVFFLEEILEDEIILNKWRNNG